MYNYYQFEKQLKYIKNNIDLLPKILYEPYKYK